MLKFSWHVSSMLIMLVVFCLISQSKARSATISTYQHLNGINVKADATLINNKDYNNNNNNLEAQFDSSEQASSGSTGIWKDFSLIYRIYQQCANENLSVCLKVKLLTGLEKILRSTKTLRLIEGVQFVGSSESNERNYDTNAGVGSTKLLTEQDIEASLPRNLETKELVLNNLIFKKLAAFLRDHTLQVKFPDIRSWHDLSDNSIESRKKKEKKGGGGAYIMIPLLLGGTFVPIAYGALAMLAGKALIVSKLALVLASIIGIKKLLSGGGGKDSHEVVVSSGGHSEWGRDIDLAYNGWKPAQNAKKIT